MKSIKLSLSLLTVAILLACSFVSASAQGFGTMVGTVTDPSGSVIPGVKVTVTDQGTGGSRSVVANDQGYFVIPALHPSTYDITAGAAGFATFSQTNVTLLADQSLTLDVQMKVGQASETVTVETDPLQVNTSSSTLSQVVEQKRIVDLPLNGRNAVALALLVPGTVQAPNDGADQGQYKTIPVAITVSANGSRANQTGFYLDGSSNNDIYTNVNQPFPFPDALQEFSVQTADYSARYGGNSGAVVDAITKSGTNAFHGDLFEFVRNRVFNAANYFGYTGGVKTVDPLKRNQFGGVIGGPIYRNHTFFFFGYQQTQIRDIANGSSALVPTAAEMNGDFSALCSAFSPAGLCTTGTQLFHPNQPTNPYIRNQIPTTTYDPAAVLFATKYLPTSPLATGQVIYGIPLSQTFNEYNGRADQVLTSKDRLFARYYLFKYENNPFLPNNNYIATVSQAIIYSQNAIVGETHVFSPSLLNDVRLSLSRVTNNAGPPPNSISAADLGIPVYQPPQFAKALDGMNVTGYFASSSFPPSIMYRTSINLSDDVSWTKGVTTSPSVELWPTVRSSSATPTSTAESSASPPTTPATPSPASSSAACEPSSRAQASSRTMPPGTTPSTHRITSTSPKSSPSTSVSATSPSSPGTKPRDASSSSAQAITSPESNPRNSHWPPQACSSPATPACPSTVSPPHTSTSPRA